MDQNGNVWEFSLVYYNNKKFGKTRDEFRLTGMTKFMRTFGLKKGDKIKFAKDRKNRLKITCVKEVDQLKKYSKRRYLEVHASWCVYSKKIKIMISWAGFNFN